MGVANGGLWEQFLSCQAPNQYGSWGVLEYMEQDRSTAPKHQALQNYINRCVFRHLQPVCRMYGDEVVLSKLQFRLLNYASENDLHNVSEMRPIRKESAARLLIWER